MSNVFFAFTLGALLSALIDVRRQPRRRNKIPRIGILFIRFRRQTHFGFFKSAGAGSLRKNIAIEYRYAQDKIDRLPDLAAELVREKVDVIVTTATMQRSGGSTGYPDAADRHDQRQSTGDRAC